MGKLNIVVHEESDFVVVFKNHDVPTVALKGQTLDNTLLGQVIEKYPEVMNVKGKNEWEGGACHRLDNQTAGLVVFARNQRFYDKLMAWQNKGLFVKTYIAQTDGCKTLNSTISTYFRAFGIGRKMVKSETDITKADSPVLYTTQITNLENGEYRCKISRGFRHQIRVHLASQGCPIKGDKLYNPASQEPYMHLECIEVQWPGFNYKLV